MKAADCRSKIGTRIHPRLGAGGEGEGTEGFGVADPKDAR